MTILNFQKLFRRNPLLNYRGKYKDQDISLVGCGQSILHYKAIPSIYHAAVNRAFLCEKIRFDFLFVQDDLGEEMCSAVRYRGSECLKFLGKIDKNVYEQQWVKDLRIHPIPSKYFSYPDVLKYNTIPKTFEKDLGSSYVADCGGTALSACQIILYLGFTRLFLVGFDCIRERGVYGGIAQDYSLQIPFWEKFKNFCETMYPNVEIISINPVGLRGLFRDVYYELQE